MEEGLLADVEGLPIPSLLPQNEDLNHVLNVLCWRIWSMGRGGHQRLTSGKSTTEYDICIMLHQMVIESFDDTILTGVKYGTVTVKSGTSVV